jgi:hypothetical protein
MTNRLTISGPIDAGNHKFIWDGTDYPSGVYLIKMDVNEFSKTQKIILMK